MDFAFKTWQNVLKNHYSLARILSLWEKSDISVLTPYLHSRRSRTTRVSMWARRTLKTETHMIKDDTEQRWSSGSKNRPPLQQRSGGRWELYVRSPQMYSHIVPFALFVLRDRSAVPRGPCLCIGALRDILCLPACLPACSSHDIWMWFSSSLHFSTGFWGPTKWRPLIHHTICAKCFIKMDYLLQVRQNRSREWFFIYLFFGWRDYKFKWVAKRDCLEK